MKLNFISALLCLASVLSVVSCSKSEKDNWSPGTPRIEWNQTEMVPLLEPTKRPVPSTATIVFPGDAIARADVHSYCTSGEERSIENAAFDVSIVNQNRIEITKILPTSI